MDKPSMYLPECLDANIIQLTKDSFLIIRWIEEVTTLDIILISDCKFTWFKHYFILWFNPTVLNHVIITGLVCISFLRFYVIYILRKGEGFELPTTFFKPIRSHSIKSIKVILFRLNTYLSMSDEKSMKSSKVIIHD